MKVHRVVGATDCGSVANPDTIGPRWRAAVFGFSAALYSEITFKNGRVEQSNFDDYPVLRMGEMPVVKCISFSREMGAAWESQARLPLPPPCATRSSPPPVSESASCRSSPSC